MASLDITIVPQCDELGYQSETFAVVTILEGGTCYEFTDLELIDMRNSDGMLDYIDVYQRDDEGAVNHKGIVPLPHNMTSEGQYDLALANWLLNSDEGQTVYCDVC